MDTYEFSYKPLASEVQTMEFIQTLQTEVGLLKILEKSNPDKAMPRILKFLNIEVEPSPAQLQEFTNFFYKNKEVMLGYKDVINNMNAYLGAPVQTEPSQVNIARNALNDKKCKKYYAAIKKNNIIQMSMTVRIGTREAGFEKVQEHLFLYRHIKSVIYDILGMVERIKNLALIMHSFVTYINDSDYVLTMPLTIMKNMLEPYGLKPFERTRLRIDLYSSDNKIGGGKDFLKHSYYEYFSVPGCSGNEINAMLFNHMFMEITPIFRNMWLKLLADDMSRDKISINDFTVTGQNGEKIYTITNANNDKANKSYREKALEELVSEQQRRLAYFEKQAEKYKHIENAYEIFKSKYSKYKNKYLNSKV